MADNKNLKDYRDRSKINTHEKYEMQYWTQKWNISSQQLVGAVKATESSSVKKVEAYLKKKGAI